MIPADFSRHKKSRRDDAKIKRTPRNTDFDLNPMPFGNSSRNCRKALGLKRESLCFIYFFEGQSDFSR